MPPQLTSRTLLRIGMALTVLGVLTRLWLVDVLVALSDYFGPENKIGYGTIFTIGESFDAMFLPIGAAFVGAAFMVRALAPSNEGDRELDSTGD